MHMKRKQRPAIALETKTDTATLYVSVFIHVITIMYFLVLINFSLYAILSTVLLKK